jgi:hypothetical protein
MATQSIPAHVLTFPSKQPIPDALALEAEGIAQLSRAMAYSIYEAPFHRLTVEERMDVVNNARTAWFTVQNVIKGTSSPIPSWERDCLTFSGWYDLALLEPQTGQVQ